MLDPVTALAQAKDPTYWTQLLASAPRPLDVDHVTYGVDGSGELPGADDVDRSSWTPDYAARMTAEGWAPLGEVLGARARAVIRHAMDVVAQAGWLPTFAFALDQLWLAGRAAGVHAQVGTALGEGHRQIPDFWAYHIPVSGQAHGYRPHRESKGPLLRPDGSPVSLTVWIPLNDATLDNGCMYVVPQQLDVVPPLTAAQQRLYGQDGLHNALLHRARALPTPAGHALSWNHHIRHWGSYSSPRATHPRMSMAFEYLRGDVTPGIHEHCQFLEERRARPPLVFDPAGPLPTFGQRLYLIGRQIMRYHEPPTDDGFKALGMELLRCGFPRGWGAKGSLGWRQSLTRSGGPSSS
jgi:hypothetical protein